MDDVRCSECGIAFGLDTGWHAWLRRSGKEFFCPLGHSQRFDVKAADELASAKLARERAEQNAMQARSERDHARAVARSLRGQITKMRNTQ